MARTIVLTHHYPYPARAVWDVATDMDAYRDVMGKLITFDSLPSGRVSQGQQIDVRISVFGVMPWQDYAMTVEAMDDAAMWFQSDERGAGIKSWRHHCSVEALDDGCRLTDRVEIDAGWKTPVFALWAKIVYRARHRPRLRILEDGRG